MKVRSTNLISIKGAAIAGAGLLILAIAAWIGTGREGYTRWPNSKLEQANVTAVPGESDLLTDIGFDNPGDQPPVPDIESRFAFGLLPGGFDPQHLISVVSTAALSIGLVAFAAALRIHSGYRDTQIRKDSQS